MTSGVGIGLHAPGKVWSPDVRAGQPGCQYSRTGDESAETDQTGAKQVFHGKTVNTAAASIPISRPDSPRSRKINFPSLTWIELTPLNSGSTLD